MSEVISTRLADDTSPTCPKTDDGEHCWHYSPVQHTIPNHRDEVCCYCGGSRCCTLSEGNGTTKSHGPHKPGAGEANEGRVTRTTKE